MVRTHLPHASLPSRVSAMTGQLARGLVVGAHRPGRRPARHPPGVALCARAGLLGVATGCRSSLGLAGPALLDRHRVPGAGAPTAVRVAALVAVTGELVADKLPWTPARTAPPAPLVRVAGGAGGALRLAARADAVVVLPALIGAAGAVAGTWGGAAWRRWAGARRPDWQGALVEDAVALLLAAAACLTGPRPRAQLRLVPPPGERPTA